MNGRNYIGGIKVNQNGFIRKCPTCKKPFYCLGECDEKERFKGNFVLCLCRTCLEKDGYGPNGSRDASDFTVVCKTRFPWKFTKDE